MPKFVIMFHGEGIELNTLPDESESPSKSAIDADDYIVGFYKSCVIRAHTEEKAISLGRAAVLSDWVGGPYAELNKGKVPSLEVESIRKLSLKESWFNYYQKIGYSFYPRE